MPSYPKCNPPNCLKWQWLRGVKENARRRRVIDVSLAASGNWAYLIHCRASDTWTNLDHTWQYIQDLDVRGQ
jgi:hypothetical protein